MQFLKNFYNKYLSVNLSDYENIKVNLDINLVVLAVALALVIASIGIYRHQTLVATLYKKLLRKEVFGKDLAVSLGDLGLADKSFRKLLTERYGNLKNSLLFIGEEGTTKEAYAESNETSSEIATSPLSEVSENPEPEVAAERAESDEDEVKDEKAGDGAAEVLSTASENPEFTSRETDNNAAKSGAAVKIYENDGLVSADAKFYIPEDKKDLANHILATNNSTLPRTLISCALILAVGLTLFFTMPEILSAINSALAK